MVPGERGFVLSLLSLIPHLMAGSNIDQRPYVDHEERKEKIREI